MEVVYTRCCGLDVHKKSISACILIRENGKEEKFESLAPLPATRKNWRIGGAT